MMKMRIIEMTMTIFIKFNELREFQQIIKDNNIRHGPFRKRHRWPDSATPGLAVGYEIDILDPGPAETYFRLKYATT